jgi:periplasmic protein TonB
MSTSLASRTPALIDDPWRRLPWLAPLSIVVWLALLCGFSLLLRRAATTPELQPISAQIVEVPVGGLQENTPAVSAAPPPQEEPAPREIVLPKPVKKLSPREKNEKKEKPPPQAAAEPNAQSSAQPQTATAPSPNAGTGSSLPGANPGLRGGTDHEGARAIYAPVPKIPDDLREEVFQAEAIARFNVSYDGAVTVSLVKSTSNPRLNQIVLDTLKQWRFTPAVRAGVSIDSVFEIRIPITVE